MGAKQKQTRSLAAIILRSNVRKCLLGDVAAASARCTSKYAYRKSVLMKKAMGAV